MTIARAWGSPTPVEVRAAEHSMLNYLLLGLVVVFLLAGLIAIGVGNKRWNWGTVAAAILTLLSACGFLVLASRMAAYEWRWRQVVQAKQTRLAEVEDGLVPRGPGGRLVESEDVTSLQALRAKEARWQRAFDRIDSWRGTHWDHSSFQPPAVGGDPADGTVELNLAAGPAGPAADGDVEPDASAPADALPPEAGGDAAAKPAAGEPPIDVGATVFLFDERTTEDGGRYLGALLVKAVAFDATTKTCTLSVAPTETPDDYDRAVWSETYDKSVTVYDRLPSDRWLAFSNTPKEDDGSGVMPPSKTRSIEDVEKIVAAADADFAREVKDHDTRVVPKDEWPTIREQLENEQALPGEYWARVKLTKAVATLGAGLDEEAGAELPEGAEVEFDLQTAFKLQDEKFGTIEEVRYRRPLRDGGTLLHGGLVEEGRKAEDGKAIPVAGVAGMVEAVRRETAIVEAWLERLQKAKQSIEAEAAATAKRKKAYAEDLERWIRDADEATRLAEAFEAELALSTEQRQTVNAEVIRLARELRAAMGALVARIDSVAPPPTQGAAATP